MKIYFVRHLKTKGNYEKRYIGWTDEELDMEKEQKIEAQLPAHPTRIYCSPLKRCMQTAERIYPEIDMSYHAGLQEMNFGFFENKTYEELKDNLHYRNFINGTEDPVDGEGRQEFKARCNLAFEEIVGECEETDSVVIICHGGTIMSIMERWEEMHRTFYEYQIPNGGVLVCEYEQQVLRIRRDESCI